MNCRKCLRKLALYAGGDLSEAEAHDVEAHLADCEDCRVRLASHRSALLALSRTAVTEGEFPEEDADYWREIEGKRRSRTPGIDRTAHNRSVWRRVPSLVAQAAVVLIVAGLVVLTQWIPGHQDSGTPASQDLIAQPGPPPKLHVLKVDKGPADPTVSYTVPEDNDTLSGNNGTQKPSPSPPKGVPLLPREDESP